MLLTFYRPESLELTNLADVISVTVSNSGEFDTTVLTYARGEGGMGLANVRRRLELCYGEEAEDRRPVLGTVYIDKYELPKPFPEKIRVMIEPTE